MYDVVTVGNALLDLSMEIVKDSPFVKIDEVKNRLCFNFGEKIHVEDCAFYPGGNACNVAVGIGRFGLNTSLYAEIGDDEFAIKIFSKLSKEPVDLSNIIQTKEANSSFSVGVYYKGERTLFVQHVKREHAFRFNNLQTKWIYLTSLGVEWKRAYESVLSFIENSGAKLAFSPGTHQYEEKDLGGIIKALKQTDILLVNREEAERIVSIKSIKSTTGIKSEEDIKSTLFALRQMGVKIASITDGKKGSFAIDENGKMYGLGIFPCKIVGRTGAGDAYASGFLSAIIAGRDVKEAMRWGAVNAAGVIEQVGAQTGLLTKEELKKRLRENPEFQAQII